MTKEEQIEEISQFICGRFEDGVCLLDKTSCDCCCAWVRHAESIYNAGYRKADEEEIDAIKKGMHFLLYSMCLQLNLGREIFVKYKIQLNNWFENYKKTQKIGAKMDGKEAEAKIKEVEKKK